MFLYCGIVVSLVANITGIKKLTVDVYLHNLVQIFSGVGSEDPRLVVLGKIYYRLSRHLHAYTQADPPQYRVCPIPISLLHECWRHLHDGDAHQRAIADLINLGLPFL